MLAYGDPMVYRKVLSVQPYSGSCAGQGPMGARASEHPLCDLAILIPSR